MPWSAAAAIGGSLASQSLFGGNSQSQPTQSNTQIYQPTDMLGQNNNLTGLLSQQQNAVSGANNPYSMLSPEIAQLFQSMYNNPGAGGYQQGGQAAGQAYAGVGQQGVANAGQLSGQIPGLLGGANQVMQLGMDPQNALYGQQLQQTNDQANVSNAQYGLQGQQAAGNVQQADQNFNTSWENQQLQRALSGLSGAGKATTEAGQVGGMAQAIGGAGAGDLLTGGQTPYGVNTAIGGQQQTSLENYITQLLGPSTSAQGAIGNLQSYLGMGIDAGSSGASQALKNYQQQSTNNNQFGQSVGSLFGSAMGQNNTGQQGFWGAAGQAADSVGNSLNMGFY